MVHIVGEGRHHSEITCKISSKDSKSCLSLRRTHQSGRRLRTQDRSQLAALVFLPIMVITSTLTLMTKWHHLASVLGSCHTHSLDKAQFHRYVYCHQLRPAENNPYWTANDVGASLTTSPFLITISVSVSGSSWGTQEAGAFSGLIQ